MSPSVQVTRSVGVGAPLAEVWHRVTTPAGINHELAPFLTMTMPANWRAETIANAPVGEHLGRARVWEHRRELVGLADRLTRVTDEVTMVPRFPLPQRGVRALINALFAHRHRRLRAWADAR